MLLPFLLMQHKVWKGCKMRIFTVAGCTCCFRCSCYCLVMVVVVVVFDEVIVWWWLLVGKSTDTRDCLSEGCHPPQR